MNAATTTYQDQPIEPRALRKRVLSITVTMLCYASLLLALYASSQLLG